VSGSCRHHPASRQKRGICRFARQHLTRTRSSKFRMSALIARRWTWPVTWRGRLKRLSSAASGWRVLPPEVVRNRHEEDEPRRVHASIDVRRSQGRVERDLVVAVAQRELVPGSEFQRRGVGHEVAESRDRVDREVGVAVVFDRFGESRSVRDFGGAAVFSTNSRALDGAVIAWRRKVAQRIVLIISTYPIPRFIFTH